MESMEFTVYIMGVLGVQHQLSNWGEKGKLILQKKVFSLGAGFKKLAHFHEILCRLPIQHTLCYTSFHFISFHFFILPVLSSY
jgi:hypothetical protein